MSKSFIEQATHSYAEYMEAAFDMAKFEVSNRLYESRVVALQAESERLTQEHYAHPQGFRPSSPLKWIESEINITQSHIAFNTEYAGSYRRPLAFALEHGRKHYEDNQEKYHQLGVILANHAGVDVILNGQPVSVDKGTSDELLGIRKRTVMDDILSYQRSPGCMDHQPGWYPGT